MSVLVIGVRLGLGSFRKTHDKHVNANGEIPLTLRSDRQYAKAVSKAEKDFYRILRKGEVEAFA